MFISPNGAGEVIIPDDTFLTFGDSKDLKIEYDEDGDNRVEVSSPTGRLGISQWCSSLSGRYD